MRLVKVEDLNGDEILARHIVTENGKELMASGIKIKTDYIDRLKELGIDYVFVKDQLFGNIDFENNAERIIHKEVEEESIKIVKEVLDKHIYKNSGELKSICEAANNIIKDIISEKEVINRVTDIRKHKKDIYSHSINVCSFATVLALKNGESKKRIEEIAKGSILHDIGYKYLEKRYESMDIMKMSENEKNEYRKHVIYGYDAIKNEKWLTSLAKEIVLLHHERNDGSGYPFKYHSDSVDNGVKIVAVCDKFDRLVNGIGCERMKVHQAVEYMKAKSVTAFDYKYVNMLLNMVALYPVGTKVILSTGDIGIVIKQNRNLIDRPVIEVISDKNGREYDSKNVIDLTNVLTVFIEDTIE